MKKTLLVLASTYPTSAEDIQPEFVKTLTEHLAGSFDTAVLVPHAPNAKLTENVGRVKVVRYRYFLEAWETLAYGSGILNNLKVNRWKWLLVPFFFLGQVIATLKLLTRERFDYLHAHWIIPQGVVAVIARKLLRNPPVLLITSHGGDLFSMQGWLGTHLKKWVLKNADQITVVSTAMKEYCIDVLGVEPEKISVVSMGVDLKTRFFPHLDVARNPFGLIFVGRLVEKKGVIYLIQAMPIILKRFPKVQLCVIGDGVLKSQLVDEVNALNIHSHVTFCGAVRNSEIPNYLSRNVISIAPSVVSGSGDQEGLGLVAVEAIGCGCAVVASSLPALADVISHEKTGLLALPESPEDIAKNVCRLLEDPDKMKQMSMSARSFVLIKFDWVTVSKRYQEILLSM